MLCPLPEGGDDLTIQAAGEDLASNTLQCSAVHSTAQALPEGNAQSGWSQKWGHSRQGP